MGSVSGPEGQNTFISLNTTLGKITERFKLIRSQEQLSEVAEIKKCAHKILTSGIPLLTPKEVDAHGTDIAILSARARDLLVSADSVESFLIYLEKVQNDLESIANELKKNPRDEKTLKNLTQKLRRLEEETDNLLKGPIAGNTQYPFGKELMEARKKISEFNKDVSRLIQEYHVRDYQEKKKSMAPTQAELEAVREGVKKNIRNWLQAWPAPLRRDLVRGPRLKTWETKCCEGIADALINHPDQITITETERLVEGKTIHYYNVKGKILVKETDPGTGREVTKTVDLDCDLNTLVSKTNFSQIRLDPACVAGFSERAHTIEPAMDDDLLTARISDSSRDAEFPISPDERQALLNLTPAERSAIHMYTVEGADGMVNFLTRGLFDHIFTKLSSLGVNVSTPEQRVAIIADAVAHAAVLHSALEKLPDFRPSDQREELLYRLELHLPQEVLNNRIRCARENRVSSEGGIFSLAHTRAAEMFWEQQPDSVVIVDGGGKDISRLSTYEDEREIVLPSPQIQWDGVTTAFSTAWNKDVSVFFGRPVNQPSEEIGTNARYISFEDYSSS